MNYMEQVAKMLGVEIGERFFIQEINGNVWGPEYYFDEDGLHSVNFDNICTTTLSGILNGGLTIKEKPWKPSAGDVYWIYRYDVGATKYYWTDSQFDITMWKIGNCYRTKEKAEADAQKWKAFVESEEQIDVLEMEESKCQ